MSRFVLNHIYSSKGKWLWQQLHNDIALVSGDAVDAMPSSSVDGSAASFVASAASAAADDDTLASMASRMRLG